MKMVRLAGQRPLWPAGHLPHLGEIDGAPAFANYQRLRKSAASEAANLPPKWGRCPAGQRGAP